MSIRRPAISTLEVMLACGISSILVILPQGRWSGYQSLWRVVSPSAAPNPEYSLYSTVDVKYVLLSLRYEQGVILDVRSAKEFSEGHLKSARNVPWDSLADSDLRTELKDAEQVIVYCDSSRCGRAEEVAKFLSNQIEGRIMLYRSGFAEWIELGLPVEMGAGR